jgi:hypothetical protein
LPEPFLGAALPVISARPNPQIWYAGSAVDQESMEHGAVFARVRARAVKAADPTLAYFGWSAPFERPDELRPGDAVDPGVWAEANPALGIRIDPGHVAMEQRSMDLRTFAVERLGVGDWPDPDRVPGQALDFALWAACADAASVIEGPPCFAFDVKPDRSWACIAAAGRRADGCRMSRLASIMRGPAGSSTGCSSYLRSILALWFAPIWAVRLARWVRRLRLPAWRSCRCRLRSMRGRAACCLTR